MQRFKGSPIWPGLGPIQDAATKSWATRLLAVLEETFRNVAQMPFNRSCDLDVADTGNADAEFTVAHSLGRTPKGWVITYADAACAVYDSGTAWTATALYLKCNAANVHVELTVY